MERPAGRASSHGRTSITARRAKVLYCTRCHERERPFVPTILDSHHGPSRTAVGTRGRNSAGGSRKLGVVTVADRAGAGWLSTTMWAGRGRRETLQRHGVSFLLRMPARCKWNCDWAAPKGSAAGPGRFVEAILRQARSEGCQGHPAIAGNPTEYCVEDKIAGSGGQDGTGRG